MARQVSLASLINQVRQRADREGSAFLTDQEIVEFINQSWARVYQRIISANENYYLTSKAYTTAANTSTYALPTDFYKDRGLDVTYNGFTWAADRFEFADRNLYQTPGIWTDGTPLAYDLWGDNIKLIPTPQTPYTVTLWYYPAPVRITAANDVLDGVAGYEEAVVLDAAVKCMQKERTPSQDLVSERDRLFAEIKSMVSDRSKGGAPRISRTRNNRAIGIRFRGRVM